MTIGKTRHGELEERYDATVGKARGVLRKPAPAGRMRHERRQPSPAVAPFIAHYWSVAWDLRGQEPHIAETLPHPNVQLIFRDGGATVSGVHTSRFSTRLDGRSRVFGIKFTPGGFRPFHGSAVSTLADCTVDARRIFGDDVLALADAVSSGRTSDGRRAADEFFRARLPQLDPLITRAGEIVDLILREPAIRTVDELAVRTHLGKRSLQRLFSEYVGVSPKWVIRRYRLHEALERLHAGEEPIDCAQLALDLGYFDQAHLSNDFKSIVGLTPAEYRARLSFP